MRYVSSALKLEEFSLLDRYCQEEGIIFLSGIQALARLPLDQHRLDRANGLNTGGFVSGYRGSPIGSLDRELWQHASLFEEHDIVFQPGVNEELAATAVWGTQQVNLFPKSRFEGVFAMWYGKAPGLDRSTDAIRHGNAAGSAPFGGALVVAGDDHAAKSSTLPGYSDHALMDLNLPILSPSNVQDVLDFGLYGWALSRYSGSWVSMIVLTDTMDSASSVQIKTPEFLTPEHDKDVFIRLSDGALEQEARFLQEKLPLIQKFVEANPINKLISNPEQAKLGIVSAGKPFNDVREALAQLGVSTKADLENAGIRLLKLGMTWPLDENLIRLFSENTEQILVVEEKRAFIEGQIKEMLYGQNGPTIVGKKDAEGAPLFSATAELDVKDIEKVLASQLNLSTSDSIVKQLDTLDQKLIPITGGSRTDRLPLFCSGCPHNTSTKIPEGSRASAGIGCHYMAQWMDRDTYLFTQMGGEGANWVGQSPFTDEPHLFINLGDGTYFHSGLLAIRQAVAAGVNVTYKVLYNAAVAMTGGQPIDGELSVASLVAQLKAEGVQRVVVVSVTPASHKALDVEVFDRDELDSVQRELREVSGCTAIVYDQTCATELRRQRKRGKVVDSNVRVLINDAVCEGCGDCTLQSNCVSVEPLDTEFGYKRKINQTSCNKDISCAKGFCPSFVRVENAQLKKRSGVNVDLAELVAKIPVPEIRLTDTANILLAGVGGTGIVTVSALLGTAAHLDGLAVSTLDMTGLAQKGGAVFGHVRLTKHLDNLHSKHIPAGQTNVLVACDLVSGASRDALALLASEHTQSFVNTTMVPTANFVLRKQTDTGFSRLLDRVEKFSKNVFCIDGSGWTQSLMGGGATSNIFMLGVAYQAGGIPISIAALEQAMTLNGVAVAANKRAFHFGRMAAHDISQLPSGELLSSKEAMDPKQNPKTDQSLEAVVATRREHLTRYQNATLASSYQKFVDNVVQETNGLGESGKPFAYAVAVGYAKLLAYKDEYEVARLYTDGRFMDKLTSQFEPGYKLKFLLAPPLLTKNKKMQFGGWMWRGFQLLAKLKFLRGTPFDPFGYLADRREERGLIEEYEALIQNMLPQLTPTNLARAIEIAELTQTVSGFGHIKRKSIVDMKAKLKSLLVQFENPDRGASDTKAEDERAA